MIRRLTDVLRTRRLNLSWMSRPQRRWARVGVAGAAATGIGVLVSGLGVEPDQIVTQFGTVPVLPVWVVVIAYLGLALTALVLLRPPHDRRGVQVGVGLLLVYVSIHTIEYGLRPLSAALGDLGAGFDVARVLAWIAFAFGVTLIVVPAQDRRAELRIGWLGGAGFSMLAVTHLAAVVGLDPTTSDLAGAALSRGIQSWATQLRLWLFLFAAWQVIEGIHASSDAAQAGVKIIPRSWIAWGLALKVILIVGGILLLPVTDHPEWEAVRSARPFGWAYAFVIATGLVITLRTSAHRLLARRSLFTGAAVVAGIWSLPLLASLGLLGLATTTLVVLPASPPDLLGLVFAGGTAKTAAAWVASRPTRLLVTITVVLASVTALVAPTSSRWFMGFEGDFVSTVGGWVDALDAHTIRWQAWALLVMPVLALIWLARRSNRRGLAMTLLVMGALILPRAVAVLSADLLDRDLAGIAPNLLMLDIALTVVASIHVFRRRAAGRPRTGTDKALIMAVAVTTVVAYGRQIGSLAIDGISRIVALTTGTDSELTSFVLLLVLPGAYALGFGAKNLNASRSDRKVFVTLGAGALLLAVAILLVPLGVMAPGIDDDDVLRVLIAPGLTLLATVVAARPSIDEARDDATRPNPESSADTTRGQAE